MLSEGFPLLGWAPASLERPVAWHMDARTRVSWPVEFHKVVDAVREGTVCDVKYPWELSRLQGLPVLAQTWLVTGSPHYLQETWAILADWSTQNPAGYGVNWACSMEVAIRAINIATAANCMATGLAAEHRAFLRRLLASHAVHLRSNLELSEVNGNHLLFDYLGIAMLALVLHGVHSKRFAKAADTLAAEAEQQFHSDGVHIEHATGYQRLVLEGLLLFLIAVRRFEIDGRWRIERVARRALPFLEAICQADGAMPAVGDNDSGNVLTLGLVHGNRAASLLELYAAAGLGGPAAHRCMDPAIRAWLHGPESPQTTTGSNEGASTEEGFQLEAFPDGGYFVIRGYGMILIMRAGASGLRGRGSHDHNDQLSLVLSAQGRALLVDPGTRTYTEDPAQHAEDLATGRHNTVCLEGLEQAPISRGSVTCTVRGATGHCEHFALDASGRAVWRAKVAYRTDGQWQHRRQVTVSHFPSGGIAIEIEDAIHGEAGPPPAAIVNFMLHPACQVQVREPALALLSHDQIACTAFLPGSGGPWVLSDDAVAFEYGTSTPTCRLSAVLDREGQGRVRLEILATCGNAESKAIAGTSPGTG
jgi:hypothetical protein